MELFLVFLLRFGSVAGGAAGVAFMASLFLKNVGATEIAIKERRYVGRPMLPGRVVASEGEVGIQAVVLKPGLHTIAWPVERIYSKVAIITIGPDEMGIVEAIDGAPLPAGRIFAPDAANNAHNNFQDPLAFLNNGGVKGIQMRTLPPGKWPIHPYLFRVSIAKQTVIPQGKIGIVTAADGAPLQQGRLLAMAVEGHNHFQDAEAFIANAGQKGSQVEILTPGTYRILKESYLNDEKKPGLFDVRIVDATVISENQIGLVEALDGQVLDSRDYVAASVRGHDNFQNGNTFISNGGQRGPQKDILRPGTYYINPSLFNVVKEPAGTINAGEAAVIISNYGADPTDAIRQQMEREAEQRLEALRHEHSGAADDEAEAEIGNDDGDPADKRLDSGNSEAYVVPDGYRGIQKQVVGPGRYYVNTWAVTPIIVPTTNQTVEWTKEDTRGSFNPFEVISKDGFKMDLEVRVVFRVKPEDAPYMVSKIGSIEKLIANVMHPTIDSIFRNQASESSAMAYLQNRHEEQVKAEAKVRAHLLRYHVDVVNVLICHIHLPEDLMITQTETVLAKQRENMYTSQQEAQRKRIELQRTTAEAENQGKLVEATIGVEIAEQRAQQRQKEAAGEAQYIRETGTAQAEVTKLQGEASGAAYKAQQEALGQSGVTLVEALKLISEGNVQITPNNLVTGGAGSGDGGGTLGGLIALMLSQQLGNRPAASAQPLPPTRTAQKPSFDRSADQPQQG